MTQALDETPWRLCGLAGELTLPPGRVTVGRSRVNALVLAELTVSARHATLEAIPDGVMVTDVGSTNGTRINNDALPPLGGKIARAGDRIRFGTTEFQLLR